MNYLDVLQEALENGLQITPYPIYSEPKHSVLVLKRALDDSVESLKQYKDFPNGLGMQETHATIAAIQDVLKQLKEMK